MDMQKPAPRHSILIIILMALTLIGSLPGLSSLQAIDRDEARYAQASVQMRASGDYVNIRFHDRERHKKPAGIYWAQTLSLNAFTSPDARKIWAHRLPSVIAGLLAVLGLYWAGLAVFDRQRAFTAALLLSISLLFVFESHIAKTDAALCAASVWLFGAVMRLRQARLFARRKQYALIFWAALACGIIIKGPILPALVISAMISIILWDKKAGDHNGWWRGLLNPLGIAIFGLICLPWYIMIFKLTGGDFFTAAISQDLSPKLSGGQENHGAPPGYYLLTIFITFWPAALFLLAGIAYAFQSLRGTLPDLISKPNTRWILAWIIPFWIILEITPTKLTHYALPLFPALALLMAGAVSAITAGEFPKTRKIGAVIFFIITTVLVFIIAGLYAQYGQPYALNPIWVYALGIIVLAAALIAAISTFKARMKLALISLCFTGLGLSAASYSLILPKLTQLRLAPRLMNTLQDQHIKLPRNGGPLIRSPHFTEPSLIYYLGENVLLGENALDFAHYPVQADHIWILDFNRPQSSALQEKFENIAAYNNICLKQIGRVDGINYSKGDEVKLNIMTMSCQQANGR